MTDGDIGRIWEKWLGTGPGRARPSPQALSCGRRPLSFLPEFLPQRSRLCARPGVLGGSGVVRTLSQGMRARRPSLREPRCAPDVRCTYVLRCSSHGIQTVEGCVLHEGFMCAGIMLYAVLEGPMGAHEGFMGAHEGFMGPHEGFMRLS
eukprot:gene6783-biopygen4452